MNAWAHIFPYCNKWMIMLQMIEEPMEGMYLVKFKHFIFVYSPFTGSNILENIHFIGDSIDISLYMFLDSLLHAFIPSP